MKLFRHTVLALASVGYVSFLPYRWVPLKRWKGGGLLGSLIGWCGVWGLPREGTVFWMVTAILLGGSVWVSHYAEKFLGTLDDPRIVVDEVAGVWVSAIGLPKAFWPLLMALLLFRFFDVWKGPWGRWVSRAPGGLGVVADDVLAGILANGTVRLLMLFR